MHRGVYLVGHRAAPRYAPEFAALLACGEGPLYQLRSDQLRRSRSEPAAFLSHGSAAAIWELIPYAASGDVHVTSSSGRAASRDGIQAHRAVLEKADIRRRHGMPLTSAARAILDLAASHGGRGASPTRKHLQAARLGDLEWLVAEANHRGHAAVAELRDQVDRNPNKPGVPALRAVLDLPGGPQRTRSPAERALLRLLRAHRVIGFEVNARIAGYEVDFLWRDLGLAVEVDGYDAHSGVVAFERDRLKVATLEANGVSVMPITGRQVRHDPDGVISRLLAALASARRRGHA